MLSCTLNLNRMLLKKSCKISISSNQWCALWKKWKFQTAELQESFCLMWFIGFCETGDALKPQRRRKTIFFNPFIYRLVPECLKGLPGLICKAQSEFIKSLSSGTCQTRYWSTITSSIDMSGVSRANFSKGFRGSGLCSDSSAGRANRSSETVTEFLALILRSLEC